MKNALLLLVIFMAVLSAKSAPSFQDGLPESITPVSAKYFPGAQMRHLIDSVTEINFTGKGMPESTYFERYAQFKTEYVKRLLPQLTKEFKTAEGIYNYGIPTAGDAAFRNGKMRLEYIYKINTVVYDIIHSSDHYFDSYMTFNTTERIMDFHSKVNVLASGEVQVAETIQIYTGGSENDRIRHGLVRNFPVD